MSGYSDIDRAFGRLDDVLAASVPLPSVDEVIARAPSVRRASSAAAAAVLTVGSLGGITAVATAAAPQGSVAAPPVAAAAPLVNPQAPTTVPGPAQPALPPAFDPTSATEPLVGQSQDPVPNRGVAAAPIAPDDGGPVAGGPRPIAPNRPPATPPRTSTPTDPGDGEGTADPTPTTDPPPTTPPTSTPPTTPPTKTSKASKKSTTPTTSGTAPGDPTGTDPAA